MSHALGPHKDKDIFVGNLVKLQKKSTKPLLRPALHQIVVQQTIQTAAHMYTECNVLFSLAQRHFAKPKRCKYLLPVTATGNEALQLLLNSCLLDSV
jgi:hypothetical protein